MIKLKNILLESMGNMLNEYNQDTYDKRVDAANTFADTLDGVTFSGNGFNELEPNYFAGQFKIISGADFETIKTKISDEYVVDEKGSTAYPPEGDEDRRYYPTIKIIGIKDSAEKPEFSVHIDQVVIDNETISPTPQFSSYEDVKDDMRDLLPDDPNMLSTTAKVEGHVKIGDNKYEFNFETQDADDDVDADQIYWQSDSFEQVTELDETDVVDKLNGIL